MASGCIRVRIFLDPLSKVVYIVDMLKPLLFSLTLASASYAQIATPEMTAMFTKAAGELGSAHFDAAAPISIRGRIATLVFPEGAAGMMLVESPSGERYAFTVAGVPAMAKQGFSRFTVKPGMEVIVTGVLAEKAQKIGPGYSAA